MERPFTWPFYVPFTSLYMNFQSLNLFLAATAPGQVEDLFGKRKSMIRRSARAGLTRPSPGSDMKGGGCPVIVQSFISHISESLQYWCPLKYWPTEDAFYCGYCVLLWQMPFTVENIFNSGRWVLLRQADAFHCRRFLPLWKVPFFVEDTFRCERCLSFRKMPFTSEGAFHC